MAEKQQSDVMTANEKEQEDRQNEDRQTKQGRQQGQSQQGQSQQGQSQQGRLGQMLQPGRESQEYRAARRDRAFLMSPFALLQRLADGVTGVFDDVAFGRDEKRVQSSGLPAVAGAWAPNVDVMQRGNELVIRADLPGLKADEVIVEASDDAITISGERQQQHEEERGGVYRFERSYGAFYRVIPLPEGAIADQAKARFDNGVLEIVVPAPPEQVARGRRLEISQGSETKNSEQQQSGQSRG